MNVQRMPLIALAIIAISSFYSTVSISEIKSKFRQPLLTREFSSGRKPIEPNINPSVDLSPVTKHLQALRLTIDSIDSNIRTIEKRFR